MKARVVYDFVGQGPNELNVSQGEEITITDQSVGAGWWQATNAYGQRGLVPSSFTELIDFPEPSHPPPPPPKIESLQTWDDEWDSDDSDGRSPSHQPEQSRLPSHSITSSGSMLKATDPILQTAIRKFFPRNFLKSGGEEFIFDADPPKSPHQEAAVVLVEKTYQWKRTQGAFTCSISSFQKDSKMKGVKRFIAYTLISPLCTSGVSRRFKQFDWLHTILTSKFIGVCIPTLPDKALTGRYDEAFIEERREKLEKWLNRICNHPVISQSFVVSHFLSCTDAKKWKQGKREAESDRYQGGRFFFTVGSEEPLNDADFSISKAENALQCVTTVERSIRNMHDSFNDHHRHFADRKKEYTALSNCFFATYRAVSSDVNAKPLDQFSTALGYCGETYRSISAMFANQTKATTALLDSLREFTNLLSSLPSVVSLSKSAILSVDEVKKAANEDRLAQPSADAMQAASLKVNRAGQAEYNWILNQLHVDCSKRMAEYLRDQAAGLQRMVELLTATANQFEL